MDVILEFIKEFGALINFVITSIICVIILTGKNVIITNKVCATVISLIIIGLTVVLICLKG